MSFCNKLIVIISASLILKVQSQFYQNYGQPGYGYYGYPPNSYIPDQYVSSLPSYYRYFYPQQGYPLPSTPAGYNGQLQFSNLPQYSSWPQPSGQTPPCGQAQFGSQSPCGSPIDIPAQYNFPSPQYNYLPPYSSQSLTSSQIIPSTQPFLGSQVISISQQLSDNQLGSQSPTNDQALSGTQLQYNGPSGFTNQASQITPPIAYLPSYPYYQSNGYPGNYQGVNVNENATDPYANITTEIIDVDPKYFDYYRKFFNLEEVPTTNVLEGQAPALRSGVSKYTNTPVYVVKSESKHSNFTSPQGISKNEVKTNSFTFKRTFTLNPDKKENAVVNLNFVNGVQVTDAPIETTISPETLSNGVESETEVQVE